MSIQREPRVVTIDLWHTLVAADPASRDRVERARQSAWVEPLVEAGLPRDRAEEDVHTMRKAAERIQGTGRSVPIPAQATLLRAVSGIRVPPERPAATIGAAVRASRIRRAPGVLEALDRLRSEGHRLALVSNILAEPPGPMHEMLAAHGLARRFDSVYLSCEHRFAKPGREPFLVAVAGLGASPREAVHIGDHSDDIVGAHAAGLPAVRFTGLLGNYPAESPANRARIPRLVPELSRWEDVGRQWAVLLGAARRAAPKARSRPGGRNAGR